MIPTAVVATMHNPANEAYVIPIGIDFMTFDNPYIQRTIVTALNIDGIINVNPSADFAKLFEAVPTITAKARNK